MEVIPAIDIRAGRCVRLYQGDFQRETVVGNDPAEVALEWQRQGASRLHVVDLDGALKGLPANLEIIKGILDSVRIPVQVGGGIRDLATVEKILEEGAHRVILGTSAVEEPTLVEEACRSHGDRIVVGVDARDGKVMTKAWTLGSALTVLELMERMASLGVPRFIYTDISRDGTLTEPNFQAIQELVERVSVPVIASGGITSIGHLKRLSAMGVEGAIVGKALYSGAIDLNEAIREVS